MRPGKSLRDTLSLTVSAVWLLLVLALMICGMASLCSWITTTMINPSEVSSSMATASQEQTAKTTEKKIALPTPDSNPANTPPEPDQGKVASPTIVIGKIIEERVNLRATPSTTADIIGKAERNDRVNLIGRSADGKWYQAKIEGTSPCWIFGATLEITEGHPNALPVVAVNP